MTQTTPGPWGLMSGMPTNVLGNGGIRVARCDFDGDFGHPECAANARLIAAAPEMREALSGVLILANAGLFKEYEGEPWLQRVREAIARAEGRS